MNLKPSRGSTNRGATVDHGRQCPTEALDRDRTRWPHRAVRYQFTLAEHLAVETRDDFPELTATSMEAGQWGTVLFGPIIDRSHLYGLLHRFNIQGLTVVEVRRLSD